MRCDYCFYVDEMGHREVASYGIMEQATLETVIRKALAFGEGAVSFCFQGGEPTLAGLDFYRLACALQDRYKKPGTIVTNSIQTNGFTIDKEWAGFFASKEFLVGLSLDGPKDLHDLHRRDPSGGGTFRRVRQAAQLLESRKVNFNILTVVSASNAGRGGQLYGFFKKNCMHYQQYIPCLDPLAGERGGEAYSLSPGQYSTFLKAVFRLWHADRMAGRFISIRYFDNILDILAGYPPESCALSGRCTNQFVVEADGSVYPCDFYVLDEWRLGNLCNGTVEELISCGRLKEFVAASREVPAKCRVCRWWALCRNGCRRDRLFGDEPLNYYCDTYRDFFDYAIEDFQKLLDMLVRQAHLGRGRNGN